MSLSAIPAKLLTAISSALLAGMLLINIALLGFWFHDVLKREMSHDRIVLAGVERAGVKPGASPAQARRFTASFADLYCQDDQGLIAVIYKKNKSPHSGTPGQAGNTHRNQEPKPEAALHIQATSFAQPDEQGNRFADMLKRSMLASLDAGKPDIQVKGSLLSALFTGRLIVLRAEPIRHQDARIGAVGVIRNLSSISKSLREAEAAILIYIVLNLIFLGLLLFFRIRSLVTLPLQRLVDLADQYHEEGALFLPQENGTGEFSQLAGSLNRMLATIEQDKSNLETTVARLEKTTRQLKKQQEEMVRAEKLASIGRMAAGLAHEIGNPLGVVQGYLGLLAQEKALTATSQDYIRRAEQECVRIGNLIRQLLDFARAQGGETRPVSLHNLVQEVVDMLQVQPDFREISLRPTFEAQHDLIKADPDQLRQVFLNFLLNSADAIRAAQEQEPGLITISTANAELRENGSAAEYIQVRIFDNGIGIDKEAMALVFDPFYTTKEPGKGTGLGLSVSLTIIESLGGRIECIEGHDKGCEFVISLPLAAKNEQNHDS